MAPHIFRIGKCRKKNGVFSASTQTKKKIPIPRTATRRQFSELIVDLVASIDAVFNHAPSSSTAPSRSAAPSSLVVPTMVTPRSTRKKTPLPLRVETPAVSDNKESASVTAISNLPNTPTPLKLLQEAHVQASTPPEDITLCNLKLFVAERFIEKLLDTDNSTTIQWHNKLTEPGGQPETNLLYPAACCLPTSKPCSAVGPSELHLQAPAPCSDLLLLVAAVQKSLITEPIHLETWHRRRVIRTAPCRHLLHAATFFFLQRRSKNRQAPSPSGNENPPSSTINHCSSALLIWC